MTLKLPVLLLLFLSFQSFAQSKKAQIAALQHTSDSLQHVNSLLLQVNVLKSDSIAATQQELAEYVSAYSEMTKQSSDALLIVERLRDSLNKPASPIEQWTLKNLGLVLPEGNFTAANVQPGNFSKNLPKEIKAEFFDPDFLGDNSKRNMYFQLRPGYVVVDLETSYAQQVFISGKYVIMSCHAPIGDYGRTIIYDLQKLKLTKLAGTNVIGFISADVIEVGQDYYTDHHVFEKSSYNIITGKYKLLSTD